jgi:hypothetical protein
MNGQAGEAPATSAAPDPGLFGRMQRVNDRLWRSRLRPYTILFFALMAIYTLGQALLESDGRSANLMAGFSAITALSLSRTVNNPRKPAQSLPRFATPTFQRVFMGVMVTGAVVTFIVAQVVFPHRLLAQLCVYLVGATLTTVIVGQVRHWARRRHQPA